MPPIKDASINDGATSVAATGGTVVTLKSLGDSLLKHAVHYGGGNPLDRKTITFSKVENQVNPGAPGGYTQGRRAFVLKHPKVLANEARTVNTFRGELAVDVETTNTEILNMIRTAGQLMADAELEDFWVDETLS